MMLVVLLWSNQSAIYTVIVVLWLLSTSADQPDDGVAVVVADIKPICTVYSECDCC